MIGRTNAGGGKIEIKYATGSIDTVEDGPLAVGGLAFQPIAAYAYSVTGGISAYLFADMDGNVIVAGTKGGTKSGATVSTNGFSIPEIDSSDRMFYYKVIGF